MTAVRAIMYASWFYLTLAIIGLLCLPMAYASPASALAPIRWWAALQRGGLRVLCGVKTEFRGMDALPKGPFLVAMKHQGSYDFIAPFLFLSAPAFILKQELLKAPVFGVYCRQSGMIAIDRDGGMKTMRKMIADAKAAAETGRQIIIFPEGTRQPVDAPPDYKTGVAGLYRALDLPCVPIAINAGLVWKGSGFRIRSGLAVFEALPAIEPGLSKDLFMQRLESQTETAVARLVAEGRRQQGVVVQEAKDIPAEETVSSQRRPAS